MGGKEGTWGERAGRRSGDQELGCSEAPGTAPRALFGADGGGELRGMESRVRPNPNCRGKTGSPSKSGLPASPFKWLCRQLTVDQHSTCSDGDLPPAIPFSAHTNTFLLQIRLLPSPLHKEFINCPTALLAASGWEAWEELSCKTEVVKLELVKIESSPAS